MTVIWVIEKQKPTATGVARALMGDFPVRVFASLESFQKLLRVNRRHPPQLVIVDAADAGLRIDQVATLMARILGDVPLLVVVDGLPERAGAGVAPAAVHVCRRPRDGLSFSSFVRELLGRARRGVIRYRDVILDYERFQYLLGPDEVAQSLPLKEAQLLRLLLEQPGVCLSRETISANLWDGLKITPRTIDSHVSRLRKRLLGAEVSIESVYGGGYVLK